MLLPAHFRCNKSPMDPLPALETRDLDMLLALPSEELLGSIMRLNNGARYHGRLNAIELVTRLLEMRQRSIQGITSEFPLHS